MRSPRSREVSGVSNFKLYCPSFLAIVFIALSLFGCTKQPQTDSANSSPKRSREAAPIAVEMDERVRVAIMSREPQQLKEALEGGAPPHGALHVVLTFGDIEMTNLLLNHGADPEELDSSGSTPLMSAAFSGIPENVRTLLERGASPDVQRPNGSTALAMACYSEGKQP